MTRRRFPTLVYNASKSFQSRGTARSAIKKQNQYVSRRNCSVGIPATTEVVFTDEQLQPIRIQ